MISVLKFQSYTKRPTDCSIRASRVWFCDKYCMQQRPGYRKKITMSIILEQLPCMLNCHWPLRSKAKQLRDKNFCSISGIKYISLSTFIDVQNVNLIGWLFG